MPSLAQRPCSEPGCSTLVSSGRCIKHTRVQELRRGTTTERGYGTDWQKLRAIKIEQDPLCQIKTHCDGTVATEVDHIIPIEDRPDLRLEWSNLQSACKACNSAKRDREMPTERRRFRA